MAVEPMTPLEEKRSIILRFIVWISLIAYEKTENCLDFSFALSNTQSPSLTRGDVVTCCSQRRIRTPTLTLAID